MSTKLEVAAVVSLRLHGLDLVCLPKVIWSLPNFCLACCQLMTKFVNLGRSAMILRSCTFHGKLGG